MVSEPTLEDTISILRGLKAKYEIFHGVHITDSALVAAADLSARYIADRFLPDKAIDLSLIHIYPDMQCDVVIAGCGVAGLYAALNLPKSTRVIMLSKGAVDAVSYTHLDVYKRQVQKRSWTAGK